MPSTKQMESRTFDLPLPFRPVMALKAGSKPETTVRVAYDLKPSSTISMMYILALPAASSNRAALCGGGSLGTPVARRAGGRN